MYEMACFYSLFGLTARLSPLIDHGETPPRMAVMAAGLSLVWLRLVCLLDETKNTE